jgi:hypothetical protein
MTAAHINLAAVYRREYMKNVFALTGMLLMSLLTSAALAGKTDPSDKYLDSEFGTVTSDVIKSLRDCPADTDAFFKNVSPFISGGPGGITGEFEWQGTFSIDGTDVTLFVYWKDDNSFRFVVQNGVMKEIGAEVDSDKLVYEYRAGPVFRDGTVNFDRLNVLESGGDSAAVNHLDICLSLLDTTPPLITFREPLDGDKVSGLVPVIVTVTDPSGVDRDSVKVSIDDGQANPRDMVCDPITPHLTEYECRYDWDTEPLPGGLYTISVVASDEAEPQSNTTTATTEPPAPSVTVEVVKSFADCFGLLDDEDFNENPIEGCEPTALVRVQVNPDTEICNPAPLPGTPEYDICFIAGKLLKPDLDEIANIGDCDACTPGYCGALGLPDPRMECSGVIVENSVGELACTGDWAPKPSLTHLPIADVAEGNPPGVLGKYVYGHKGCFAAAQHTIGAALPNLYEYWPDFGLVFIKVHGFADLLPDEVVADCNVGLPEAAQAGYQPIGKNRVIDTLEYGTVDDIEQFGDSATAAITLAATQKCNAPRTLSRDNGIDVSNVIEWDGSGDPTAFKYQMVQMQFDALFVALGCAEPTFNRRGQSKFSNVSSPINQAKAQFDNGTKAALERARDDLRVAADAIRTSDWDVTAENCAGDALARTENLAWRMTDLICAQTTPGTGDCEASPYP